MGERKTGGGARSALSKARLEQFFTSMEIAAREKDVEKAVESTMGALLRDGLGALHSDSTVTLSYPHNTDGLISITAPTDSLFSMVPGEHESAGGGSA